MKTRQVHEKFVLIPTRRLFASVLNPRDELDVTSLSDSVGSDGVIQPLLVRPAGRRGFEVCIGVRRFAAIKRRKLPFAPCIVKGLSDTEVTRFIGVENLERKPFTPVEEVKYVLKLLDINLSGIPEYGEYRTRTKGETTPQGVPNGPIRVLRAMYNFDLGNANHNVMIKLRKAVEDTFASLPASIKTTYGTFIQLHVPLLNVNGSIAPKIVWGQKEKDKITESHARVLATLRPSLQKKVYKQIVKEDLSVKDTRSLVKKVQAPETWKAPEIVPINLEPELYTLWNIEACDPRFGLANYPGRMPGQIVYNFLYYFTDDNDLLVDTFAGSGTSIDVVKAMTAAGMPRRIEAYDINPPKARAQEIVKHDIRDGFLNLDVKADAIILDPPHWHAKQGEYTNSESDLSNLKLEEFYHVMSKLANDCKGKLAENGCVGLLIGGENHDEKFFDLSFDCYFIFKDAEFTPVERVMIPARGFAGHTALWQHRAKENKFMLRGFRDFMIFRCK